MNKLEKKQKIICSKFKSPFKDCDLSSKVGISQKAYDGEQPIHGMRVNGRNNTSGWFLWSGEWSEDDDFFMPLHTSHLIDRCPMVLPYLGLDDGWRFLLTDTYEDVWYDPDLFEED